MVIKHYIKEKCNTNIAIGHLQYRRIYFDQLIEEI